MADLSEEFLPHGLVLVALDTLRRIPVYDTYNTISLFRRGNDRLKRICGGTVDRANFRAILDPVKNIDRECFPHENTEYMAGTHRLQDLIAGIHKTVLIPFAPDEAWTRRLRKGDSELCLRHRCDHDLVKVLYCLDKVCLTRMILHPSGTSILTALISISPPLFSQCSYNDNHMLGEFPLPALWYNED